MNNPKKEKSKKRKDQKNSFFLTEFNQEKIAFSKMIKEIVCPKAYKKLRSRCLSSIESFSDEGVVTNTPNGPLIFRDNDSDILAVAHLDTVRQDRHFGFEKSKSDILYNCQLDDRLGAWIILDVLPEHDITVDVLLTTEEESCMSTAEYFTHNKQYNWLVEFDRAGTDVVTYKYRNTNWLNALRNEGNRIKFGSYSDICVLEHLEAQAVNWGIGSYDGHNRESWCSISELNKAIDRFVEFYKINHEIYFPHEPGRNCYPEKKSFIYDELDELELQALDQEAINKGLSDQERFDRYEQYLNWFDNEQDKILERESFYNSPEEEQDQTQQYSSGSYLTFPSLRQKFDHRILN